MNPQTKTFIDSVLARFTEQITDRLFLFIQENKDLMDEYRETVCRDGLQEVNKNLGMAVKRHFNLDNGGEESTPKSILISSYHKHKTSLK